MNIHEHLSQLFKLLLIILLSLLPINIIVSTNFASDIREVGLTTTDYTLYLSAILIVLYLIINKNYWKGILDKFIYLYIASGLFIIINLVSHIYNSNFNENSTFIELIFSLLIIIAFAKVTWSPKLIINIGFVASFIVILIFIHWQVLDNPTNRFQSIFRNPNGLGIVAFCLIFFQIIAIRFMPLIYKSYFYITICLNVVLVYVTTSRAVWLALLVSLISFIVIKFYREKSKHLFGITIGTSFTLVFLYIQLEGTRLGDWLNDQSREHFSKNFFSGRSGLWAELWEAIMASPVIGHGVGVHARDITSYQLTSHNQFLQTMLESGFIGFVILIGLLLSLWLLLLKNLNHGVTVWSMSFFVGILVYQSLEMSLFINNTWFGLFQWLIICIGISFKDNYTKTDKNL